MQHVTDWKNFSNVSSAILGPPIVFFCKRKSQSAKCQFWAVSESCTFQLFFFGYPCYEKSFNLGGPLTCKMYKEFDTAPSVDQTQFISPSKTKTRAQHLITITAVFILVLAQIVIRVAVLQRTSTYLQLSVRFLLRTLGRRAGEGVQARLANLTKMWHWTLNCHLFYCR